jgi:acyl carrier protein
MITNKIRMILKTHGNLSADAVTLADNDDLYEAGLSSFATVQLMLALEDEFGVEIPEKLLNRRTFASISALADVIDGLSATRRTA